MTDTIQPTSLGKRKEPHTVIIARGDEIRHFQIRPWLAALGGSVLAATAVGYLLATSYLVLRDDLLNASTARQARLQQSYEDRISALRGQVDRITSRQMLDQQVMETKVGELLARQSQLNERQGRLGPILDRIDQVDGGGDKPVDTRPDLRAGIGWAGEHESTFAIGGVASSAFGSVHVPAIAVNQPERLFAEINQSLRAIEDEQLSRINEIAEDAYRTADAIASALEEAGLKVDLDPARTGVGGPFVPIDNPALFDAKVKELDEALDLVERMKSEIQQLPIANPAPGYSVSSTFGVRRDPLLGTPAMHSGMDFRAPTGAEVLAAADGIVVAAGWNGGYGRMVEIRHADGFTSRYAHMSKILVTKGQEIAAGDVLGKVGSSGRSTGPHLHYEVHRHGEAINPVRFLKAGRKIDQYL